MIQPLPFFLAVAVLLALLAFLTIWSRRGTYARPLAVLLFPIGLAIIFAAYVQALGYHRPLAIAWGLPKTDLLVRAVVMEQDRAIWLYVQMPGRVEPLPLELPFDNELADKLAKLGDQSQQDGQEGTFLFNFDPSLDVHADQFHALPQERQMPPKEAPPEPRFYQDS